MQYTTFTDQGSRQYNEDSYGMEVHGDSRCFVLADGLGGHGGGDVASQTAVRVVCELFKLEGFSDSFFEKAFNRAQEAILAEQEKAHNHDGMKTTLVVLIISDGKVHYAHVGDSRLYVINDGHIKQRTLDHSVPQMLVLSKEIKEKDIRHHPDRSRLLRVLGVQGESPKCDIAKPLKLKGNLSFLLCSDGYWELVEDKDIEAANKAAEDTDEWISRMNTIVRKNGEGTDMDNYTAVAVWVSEGDISLESSDRENDGKIFKVEFEEPGKWNPLKRRKKEKDRKQKSEPQPDIEAQPGTELIPEGQTALLPEDKTELS